ncbi:MAG: hypothetical protein OEX02_21125 [Cyclobacteriaceae bacterium]|nr:hypothetical protein [Cyclobacteriaceae bacterium]
MAEKIYIKYNYIAKADPALIKESYERAISGGNLVDRFNEIFINSHPAIKVLMGTANFSKQKFKWQQSINKILQDSLSEKSFSAKPGNEFQQVSFNENDLEISIYWKESLIAAIAEFDPFIDSSIIKSWNQALTNGLHHIDLT